MTKNMTPEEKARLAIDEKLNQSGWVIQDMKRLNLSASLGVAVREFPTSTGEVDLGRWTAIRERNSASYQLFHMAWRKGVRDYLQ